MRMAEKKKNLENDQDLVIRAIPRSKLQAGGRKRWKGVPKEERSRLAGERAKARWAALTPEQRSAEMRRRAKKRKRKKKEPQ